MNPLDATLRAGSAVVVLALSGALSGCYYVPYGYYPGYGYYPAYPAPYSTAYSTAYSSGYPVAPGDVSQQAPAPAEFNMPDGTSPDGPPPTYDFAPAPAYGAGNGALVASAVATVPLTG